MSRKYDETTGEFYCYECKAWFERGESCGCSDRLFEMADEEYERKGDEK